MSDCKVSTAPAPLSREPTFSEIGGRDGFPPDPAFSAASPLCRSWPPLFASSVGCVSPPPFLSVRRVGFASAPFPAASALFP
eukprot:2501855-Pleurochrysis_carterae.AAC.1